MFAIGDRCFRGIAVLDVPAKLRQLAVELTLPPDLARVEVDVVDDQRWDALALIWSCSS